MRLFGFEITRAKDLRPASDRGRFWSMIRESYAGAWQQNVTINYDAVLSFHAVFACMTMIAHDIAKVRVKLVERRDGIWTETTSPAYSPVLRKPNHYQTRIQFFEHWILSKIFRGNTYVLKRRDGRGVVTQLFILDPNRVQVLYTDDGDVYYELALDEINRLTGTTITVPASEIIHDRADCLFHPLVGTSPLYAAGLAATQGLSIQKGAAWFFGNRSIPSGVLSAPGHISDDTAARLKESWETKFAGEGTGKIAVLGDDLRFEPMMIKASDSQLIEQLKYTAESICSVFHIPPYKLGIGPMPTNNNVQALNLEYYSTTLQYLFESLENCLDDGLATGENLGVWFDENDLLRMDSKTLMEVLAAGIGGKLMTPNEGRKRLDLPPVKGGDTVFAQQQDFSLAALAERDANDPFSKPEPAPTAPPADEPADEGDAEEMRALMTYAIRGRLEDKLNAA